MSSKPSSRAEVPAVHLALVADLPAHDDRTWNVAWNPAEPLLASCSADKNVHLWSYRLASTSSAPSASGTSASTANGTTEHQVVKDPEVIVKDAGTIATGHAKTVRAVAWSPSGLTLATASFDANVGVWERAPREDDEDMDDGEGRPKGEWECASLLEGHETECKSVGYSASGTLLASCGRDKSVWIWEVHPDADFECAAVLMEHTQDVKCVAWHPSEDILASASYDDTINIYADDPADDWACVQTLKGHSDTVWALTWCPFPSLPSASLTHEHDRGYLASAGADGTVRIWRRSSKEEWAPGLLLDGVHERAVLALAWGAGAPPKGEDAQTWLGWLASAGSDGVINVWSMQEAPEEKAGLKATHVTRIEDAHGVHDINTIAWCPRAGLGRLLASAGDDGCVRVWALRERAGE